MMAKVFKYILFLLFSCLISIHSVYANPHVRSVKLATDPWPPFYGPNLTKGGFFSEIVSEAFKEAGYRCTMEFVPWNRAFVYSKRGMYSGLLGTFYTKKRTKFFVYSMPIAKSEMVFFSKRNRKIEYKNLRSLKPYRIGIIRGYHYSEEFDKARFLGKVETDNIEQAIRMILNNRFDILLGSKPVVQDMLKRKFPGALNSLEVIRPPLSENLLYVAISKKIPGYKRKIHDLNRGLMQLKKKGVFLKILKKHGIDRSTLP